MTHDVRAHLGFAEPEDAWAFDHRVTHEFPALRSSWDGPLLSLAGPSPLDAAWADLSTRLLRSAAGGRVIVDGVAQEADGPLPSGTPRLAGPRQRWLRAVLAADGEAIETHRDRVRPADAAALAAAWPVLVHERQRHAFWALVGDHPHPALVPLAHRTLDTPQAPTDDAAHAAAAALRVLEQLG